MLVQISSGQGPAECELAVAKLFEALTHEYSDMELVSSHRGRYTKRGCFASMTFSTAHDLSALEGTMLWICRSPFRPHHRRKNWYVDVSVISEREDTGAFGEGDDLSSSIRIETFHCGGKGGQNVNKVETGVRIVHVPTGLVASSTEERSQYQNRRKAMARLRAMLTQREIDARNQQTSKAWGKHTRIVRGDPVRIYEGMDFKRKR